MPTNKDFKRLVRDRAARTGESYSTARTRLLDRRTNAKMPLVCAVTGASGRVAYNLAFRLAAGDVFGTDQPISLQLLDVEDALPSLEGVALELEDCSYSTLTTVDITSDYAAGFADASWALLLGAPRREAGMERADLLASAAPSFAAQGAAIAETASDDVRVLAVGNPANTNCLIARAAAPDVPDERWFALLRLDHNRARSQLAAHADVPLTSVTNVSVWGNHSPTMVPDIWHARIKGVPATEVVDAAWVEETFIPEVQNRGARVIEVAGGSSAASAAAAIVDSIRDLIQGTPVGDWTTLGCVSHGQYGVPDGLVFGFPTTVAKGRVTVVDDLELNATHRRLLNATVAELEAERSAATTHV